jgi:hypothetical protein
VLTRTKLLVLGSALAALVLTSIAAASHVRRGQTADVAATFTAGLTRFHSRTCQGENGVTFHVQTAVWRGMSTSTEPRLAGRLVLRTRAVVNATTGDGWLTGSWHSRANPSSTRGGGRPATTAHLSAVIDDSTHIDGLASGRVYRPWGHLRGNFSAVLGNASIAGALGTNAPVAPDNSALIFRGGCH